MRDRIEVVTTTPTLEGWEIQSYLGPVSAHVVAGTGLFSDWIASWTDVLGGRSGTYQKQLRSINEEAINRLKKSATMLGANCVVGVRIDHDEISGKGKAMFMVTAMGTAVRARRAVAKTTSEDASKAVVASELVETLLKKQDLMADISKFGIRFEDETWRFITENRIHEVADHILDRLAGIFHAGYAAGPAKEFIERSRSYLLNLPDDKAKEILYSELLERENNRPFVVQVIQEGRLIETGKILELLESDDYEVLVWTLKLLLCDKSFYSQSDVHDLETLRKAVESLLVLNSEDIIEEKDRLSRKVQQKWICVCGAKVSLDQETCRHCGRDRTGFDPRGDAHPKKIADLLGRKIGILQQLFSQSEQERGSIG